MRSEIKAFSCVDSRNNSHCLEISVSGHIGKADFKVPKMRKYKLNRTVSDKFNQGSIKSNGNLRLIFVSRYYKAVETLSTMLHTGMQHTSVFILPLYFCVERPHARTISEPSGSLVLLMCGYFLFPNILHVFAWGASMSLFKQGTHEDSRSHGKTNQQ